MHGIHQILHLLAVSNGIHCRQEDRPSAAEDEKAHAGLLGLGPPFMVFLKVDECVNGEAQFRNGEGKDDSKQDAFAKSVRFGGL